MFELLMSQCQTGSIYFSVFHRRIAREVQGCRCTPWREHENFRGLILGGEVCKPETESENSIFHWGRVWVVNLEGVSVWHIKEEDDDYKMSSPFEVVECITVAKILATPTACLSYEECGVTLQPIPEFPLRHSSKFNKIKIHTHTLYLSTDFIYFIFTHFIFIKLQF